MSYKKIMVGLCGRGDENKVIQEVVELARVHGAELTVLHVDDPHAGEMSMMMDNPEDKHTEADIRNWFKAAGCEDWCEKIQIKIVTGSSIPKTIGAHIDNADLLVLGHRRMNVFKKNFFDSVDEGIVNNVHCPVLIVQK
ncbi:MAG: universal stress protein [Fidelibacterota bacterium]